MPKWQVVMTCTVVDTLEARVEVEAPTSELAADRAIDLTTDWTTVWMSMGEGEINLENVDVDSVTLLPSTTVVNDSEDQP